MRNVNKFHVALAVQQLDRFVLSVFLVNFRQLGRAFDHEFRNERQEAVSRLAVFLKLVFDLLRLFVLVRDRVEASPRSSASNPGFGDEFRVRILVNLNHRRVLASRTVVP